MAMMEKRNMTIEKLAAGDSRDIDDIVDAGARRFAKPDAAMGRRSSRGVRDIKGPEVCDDAR